MTIWQGVKRITKGACTNGSGEVHVVAKLVTYFHRAVLGLPTTELSRLQVAGKPRKYVDFYTRETRWIVAKRFREDIEMFGYEFETG